MTGVQGRVQLQSYPRRKDGLWEDRDGNMGWQSAGIAPVRRNWSGLVPVPGDGKYEWDGYLEIKEKPHSFNPEKGYFATANSNLTPRDYPYREVAIAWEWTDPFRWSRLNEVMGRGSKFSLSHMARLQTDYSSHPARILVPMLKHLPSDDRVVEKARLKLLSWDYQLNPESVKAGIYVAWQREVRAGVRELFVADEAKTLFPYLPMKKIIDWLAVPDGHFGDNPIVGRDQFLLKTLARAVVFLIDKFGPAMDNWRYGQPEYKHIKLLHPLSEAVNEEIRNRIEVGPYPRGGDSYTVNNTGGWDNQRSGASFRIIVDTADWDRTLAMNITLASPETPTAGSMIISLSSGAKTTFSPSFIQERRSIQSPRKSSFCSLKNDPFLVEQWGYQ